MSGSKKIIKAYMVRETGSKENLTIKHHGLINADY
jgi:hypothetical protein